MSRDGKVTRNPNKHIKKYTFGVLCSEFTKRVRNCGRVGLAIHSLYIYYNYISFAAALRGYPTSIRKKCFTIANKSIHQYTLTISNANVVTCMEIKLSIYSPFISTGPFTNKE